MKKQLRNKMKDKLIFRSVKLDELKKLMLSGFFKKKIIFNFLNAYSIYLFKKNEFFREVVSKKRNFNFIDGFTVSFFLSLKNFKILSRLRGPDFTQFLLEDKDLLEGKKHFFIGFEEKDLDDVCGKYEYVKKKNIFAYNPPYIKTIKFSDAEISKMIKMINKHEIDYLWIGVGNPKQEILANDLYNKVKAKYIFNVGAAFDFILEKKKRAPKLVQNLGIEWFYRLITDFKYSWKKVWRSLLGSLYALNIVKLGGENESKEKIR